jgi:hypothetical protein
VAEQLSERLRKQLDNTPPRLLVDYLAERLGPTEAEEALGRAIAGEAIPLPPDTRSLAERLVEQVGLLGPGRLELEVGADGDVRSLWTHEKTMVASFGRFDGRELRGE